MSEAAALIRLQEIDLTLMRLKKQAEALPQAPKIAAAREAAKKVASQLTKIGGQRKDLEMELQDLEEAKLEAKERSVIIRQELEAGGDGYRTVQDYDARLSYYAKRIEKADFDSEKALAQLETVERAEANARALKERIEAEGRALEQAWRQAAADITAQVKELGAERERLVAEVTPELMRRYEQAKKRFGGLAVETLEGNKPSACRVALQPSSYSDIRRAGSDVTTCPYCKRILIVSQEG